MTQLNKESQIKKEIFIACPFCYSGNSFQLEQREQELPCADCGFILAKNPKLNLSEPEECVFRGSSHFYFEAPRGMTLTVAERARVPIIGLR